MRTCSYLESDKATLAVFPSLNTLTERVGSGCSATVPDFSETTDDPHGSSVSRMTFDREAVIKFVVFWIGSSAIRAFGGCLGSKRR